jgi:hypothetical protein
VGGVANLDFVEKLDPALKRVRSPFSPAHLAVHVLRRQSDFFQPRKAGLAWADPVECLLDLHESRLEPQAEEFLEALRKRVKSPP